MTVHFHISYHTRWGESVFLVGNVPQLGGGDPEKAVEMSMTGPGMWELELDMPATVSEFDYSYIVKSPGQAWKFEWGTPHRFTPGKGVGRYSIFSNWLEMPYDKPFFSSAFTQGIFHRLTHEKESELRGGSLKLRVSAPVVKADEWVIICGEGDLLGNWDPTKAPRLKDGSFPEWEITLRSQS